MTHCCASTQPAVLSERLRKPPRTAIIKRPVLVPVSARGSASDRNCALASTICLTMANRSNVRMRSENG